jgi:RNA polymerase sigma factor (sigma-70 family)
MASCAEGSRHFTSAGLRCLMVRDMMEDPFESVVAAHHAEIHRYLVRATSRPGDADDLSQETFVRAYKAYRSLPPDANVRAWLFTIATNLYRNHFRAEGRRRQAMVMAAAGASERGSSWPEGEAIASQTSARIDRIVTALPFKQRLAFTLRKVHELDYEAIAASLQCSGESARAHVFQALRKIRRGLDDLDVVHTERQP